jgi:hypothetical protein
MKKLDISSPDAQRVSQLVMFERVQSDLSLYPGKIAAYLKDVAKDENREPSWYIGEFRNSLERTIRFKLSNTLRLLQYQKETTLEEYYPQCGVAFYKLCSDYLQFDSADLAESLQRKCRGQELDPVTVIKFLLESFPIVLHWSLNEVQKILRAA